MASWRLSPHARTDLHLIMQSVSAFTGYWSSAASLWNELQRKFELIAFMPNAVGRKRDDGTQEAFCRGYRIIYEVIGEDVYILTVVHSSRLYPKL